MRQLPQRPATISKAAKQCVGHDRKQRGDASEDVPAPPSCSHTAQTQLVTVLLPAEGFSETVPLWDESDRSGGQASSVN